MMVSLSQNSHKHQLSLTVQPSTFFNQKVDELKAFYRVIYFSEYPNSTKQKEESLIVNFYNRTEEANSRIKVKVMVPMLNNLRSIS